jgi:hypothetical protein
MSAPTKIQWINYPGWMSTTTWHVRLPNAAAAGDSIFITGQFGSGTDVISAIADDQGGSLAGGQWVKDGVVGTADNQSICLLRRVNVPASTRVITITFSATTGFSQFEGLLVNNIATTSPLDGTVATNGAASGTSIAAGNVTTTTTNTFWVSKMAVTTLGVKTVATRFTAPAGFTLWAPNGVHDTCCMYGNVAAAGTFNPAIQLSRSVGTSAMITAAYKTTTSGGSPSVKAHVQFVYNLCLNDSSGNFSISNGGSATFDLPAPSTVNALLFHYDDGGQQWGLDGVTTPVSKIVTNPANTFTGEPIVECGSPASSACLGCAHVEDASVSEAGSITLGTFPNGATSTASGFFCTVYGMANVESKDQFQSGRNTLATVPPVTQNNVLGTALTLAEVDELVLFFSQEERQTVTAITATNGTPRILVPDTGVYESNDTVHDSGMAILDGLAAGTTVNFNITWSNYEGGLTVEQWGAFAISFKTRSATPQTTRPSTDNTVGTWVPGSGAASLASNIDEATTDDTDYITTPSTASACQVALPSVTDPSVSTGHRVRYRAKGDGTTDLIVRLKQGTTTIASWTEVDVPANWTEFRRVLTTTQTDSITNYADLRLEFETA